MPCGPVWYSLCVYGPCRTPVSGQYAVGESELADIGRGRCSAAGVADLSALGHFWQRRPAGGTHNTHSGTGPALAAHPGVPLRRMRAGRHVARWAGRLEGGAIHEGLLSSHTVIISHSNPLLHHLRIDPPVALLPFFCYDHAHAHAHDHDHDHLPSCSHLPPMHQLYYP